MFAEQRGHPLFAESCYGAGALGLLAVAHYVGRIFLGGDPEPDAP